MAEIIDIPATTPAYTVIIAAERQPCYEVNTIENGRQLIAITARTWQEAEQLRDRAAGAIKRKSPDPCTKAGAVISRPAAHWTE